MTVHVFVSHSSKDKPAVEKLAGALKKRGIKVWLDKWQIGPGDDIVTKINAGLEQANAGIVVFSKHSRESRWVEAETSYLTYARIQEGKILIPVKVGDDAWVPPLLRPLAYRGINEAEAIADALLNRKPVPPAISQAPESTVERVVVTLNRSKKRGVRVDVRIGEQGYSAKPFPSLPRDVESASKAFLQGFSAGLRRNPDVAKRAQLESTLARLGRALTPFCFPR